MEMINFKRKMAFLVCFFAFLVFWKSLLSQKLRMQSFGELLLSITADMLQHSPHSSAEEETFRTIDCCIQHVVLNVKYHPPTNSLEICFQRDYQMFFALEVQWSTTRLSILKAQRLSTLQILTIVCLCALSVIHHKFCKFCCY